MDKIFRTYKPRNEVIAKFVDYYYVDKNISNKVTEYTCFPHFNNTISIYRSHQKRHCGDVVYIEGYKPLQIYTPIREKVLIVRQIGQLERIVIVFNPLGIHHFFRDIHYHNSIIDYDFFSKNEIGEFFEINSDEILIDTLDNTLLIRFHYFEKQILSESIDLISKSFGEITVEILCSKLMVSRKHLNRQFQKYLGIPTKKFIEIVKFRAVINRKIFEKNEMNLTELAYEFNFCDQAHFNKTIRKLTAKAPKNFFTNGILLGDEDIFWHIEK